MGFKPPLRNKNERQNQKNEREEKEREMRKIREKTGKLQRKYENERKKR